MNDWGGSFLKKAPPHTLPGKTLIVIGVGFAIKEKIMLNINGIKCIGKATPT